MSRSSYHKANFGKSGERNMESDNEKIKGDMVIFAMRAGLFLFGLIGFFNVATLVISKIREADSAMFYLIFGGMAEFVAAYMMFGAIAGKWSSSERKDKRVQGPVEVPQHVLPMEDLKQLERSRDLRARDKRVRRDAGSRAS